MGMPETILVVPCHLDEFVQMGLLLADPFLGMKEKCREEETALSKIRIMVARNTDLVCV